MVSFQVISSIRPLHELASDDESYCILPSISPSTSATELEELIMPWICRAKIVCFAPGLGEVV